MSTTKIVDLFQVVKCDERHDFGSNDKAENAHLLHLGKYCCMVDLLFYLFGFSCVANVELLTILLFGRIQTQVILTKLVFSGQSLINWALTWIQSNWFVFQDKFTAWLTEAFRLVV